MSRSFEYFFRRTSIDLGGPLCIQTWGHYILSASTHSPAVQHGIAALSGIHECNGLPESARSKTTSECWKHYYLAVKATNALVAALQDGSKHYGNSKEELLIVCAIFIIIEVLLGNVETALRHLEGCFSLIQTYFRKTQRSLRVTSGDFASNTPPTYLDSHLVELVGFFTRLDLQLLSLLPPGRYPARKSSGSSLPAISELSQPLPSVMSTSLHHIIKQSLYWTQNQAATFKYAPTIPAELYET